MSPEKEMKITTDENGVAFILSIIYYISDQISKALFKKTSILIKTIK